METLHLLGRIAKIPQKIKEAAAKFYVHKCCQLHAIAFLQWRQKHPQPSCYSNKEELAETIETRKALFFVPPNYNHITSQETHEGGALPDNFIEKYEWEAPDDPEKEHLEDFYLIKKFD